jgi:hypothetical protein
VTKSRIPPTDDIPEVAEEPKQANGPPPKSVFLREAEVVEETLKLWLGLGLASANRVGAMSLNHLQQITAEAVRAEKAKQ